MNLSSWHVSQLVATCSIIHLKDHPKSSMNPHKSYFFFPLLRLSHLAILSISWVWPPPSNSDHQDYFPLLLGGGQMQSIRHISKNFLYHFCIIPRYSIKKSTKNPTINATQALNMALPRKCQCKHLQVSSCLISWEPKGTPPVPPPPENKALLRNY